VIVRESTVAELMDSVISVNSVGALVLSVTDNQTAEITIENCMIAHNTSVGVLTSVSGNGASARAFLSQNVIAYNTQGAVPGAGAIFSFNNNRFVGNSADGGPFGSVPFE